MYEDRVARGAELLDRARPGWAAEVAADELAMASCDGCILGQIYGDYRGGWRKVLMPLSSSRLYSAADHGFTLDDAEQDVGWAGEEAVMARFAALADAWRAEIRARAAGAAG